MKKPKVAIIGAGIAGLSCARHLEEHGIIPRMFERQMQLGWMWPSASIDVDLFTRVLTDDIRDYLKKHLGVDLKPLAELTEITLKSPNHQVDIKGNLGYVFRRGKDPRSISSQLFTDLLQVCVHMNCSIEYEQIKNDYDYIVVADGLDTTARKLGVWEDIDKVFIYKALVTGNFKIGTSKLYFNTDYAGSGYARLTPLSQTQAILAIYVMGYGYSELDLPRLFEKFLEQENLNELKIIYKIHPLPFTTGRVSQFRVGNTFLTGRAAGLTERVMGVGFVSAIYSGVAAAQAIADGKDYDKMLKPLKTAIENVSAFRTILNTFDNDQYDQLLKVIDTPGVKETLYGTDLNFVNTFGKILKLVNPVVVP